MKILIKIWKIFSEYLNFLVLSILIAGWWGVGCFPFFANYLRVLGKRNVPFFFFLATLLQSLYFLNIKLIDQVFILVL